MTGGWRGVGVHRRIPLQVQNSMLSGCGDILCWASSSSAECRPKHLVSVYYDTSVLTLLHSRPTLRMRRATLLCSPARGAK